MEISTCIILDANARETALGGLRRPFHRGFGGELRSVATQHHLRRIRRAAGLSQSELARETGVNVRNIQLNEQRAQDIDRASAATLAALARRLGCSIENLMEGP